MDAEASYPRTLPELFGRALRKYADRTALVGPDGGRLSYAEVDDRSRALAARLAAAGVSPGDRVAVLMDNRPAVPVADAAVARAGAVRLPLNPMSGPETLRYEAADADAVAVVTDDPNEGVAATLGDDADGGVAVVRGDRADAGTATDAPDVSVAPDALAGHYYTGGTTGRPKGVHYTHETIVANLLAHPPELGFAGDDVGLLTTPLAHSAGTFCWASLLVGGTVHVRRGFDPGDVLDAVEREGVTWTFAVPTMIHRLLDHDRLDDADLSSLDRVVYGTAPMRPDRLREGVERLGPVFLQFYGQTEVPNLVTTLGRAEHARAVERGDDDRLRSAGTPCLQSAVRVVDPETGEACAPGDPGEVEAAAPYAFDGYHDRPEAEAATRRGEWVRTGDVGVVDDEGYLTLLDRIHDVIVTGGFNVYPRTVERALTAHPGVAEAAVVGVPDDEWGEAVHAVVVRDDGGGGRNEDESANRNGDGAENVTEAELTAFAADRLADYERPKSVEFVRSLPETSVGKLDREAVRERHWADRERSI